VFENRKQPSAGTMQLGMARHVSKTLRCREDLGVAQRKDFAAPVGARSFVVSLSDSFPTLCASAFANIRTN
jgi:hypothetical protein